MKPSLLALALVVCCSPTLAQGAQNAPPNIVRGTVRSISPGALVVAPRGGGAPVTIGLQEGWTVQVTQPISIEAIKPGSFIGTSEMPQADGSGRSLEVHVFPPGVKAGEGHYAWNLKGGSMMTNGTVGSVVASAKGRELEVNYTTGKRKIMVPPKVPIVSIGPGDRSMVKVGSPVVVMVPPQGAGPMTTRSVAVGVGGKPPPF